MEKQSTVALDFTSLQARSLLPTKNHVQDCLMGAPLQLAGRTFLTIDETVLTEGQLNQQVVVKGGRINTVPQQVYVLQVFQIMPTGVLCEQEGFLSPAISWCRGLRSAISQISAILHFFPNFPQFIAFHAVACGLSMLLACWRRLPPMCHCTTAHNCCRTIIFNVVEASK